MSLTMKAIINTHYVTGYASDQCGETLGYWAELDVAALEQRANYCALIHGYTAVEFTYTAKR